MIKKLIIIIFSLLNLVLFSNFVFSLCPNVIDTPNELRGELRTLIFNYLSDPNLYLSNPDVGYTTNEILDLLDFYKTEKDKSLVTDCDALGSRTNTQVYTLMEKTIVFQRECSTPGNTRTCGQTDVGVCDFGIQTCTSTYLLGSCVGTVYPSDEICDNLDNNCDGQVDEDLSRSTNEIGACSINTETCINGVYTPNNEYTLVAEPTCDNDLIDNNCDGSDAPTCDSISLSSSLVSIPADGATNANIVATRTGSDNNLIITFSSDRAGDILSTTCNTGTSGSCSISVKSLEVGTSTITASASGYVDGNIVLTFTNIKPTVQPITFAESDVVGSNTKGSTITLQCKVNDINANDNPVKDKLAVKVWAGQCDTSDCLNTRSWVSGIGITYHNAVLMDAPTTGNTFTKILTINQDVGTGIAATCQATDSAGGEGNFGDAYPLLTVGCSATSPTFSSITATPNPAKAGTVTITFTSSGTLISNPTVTLKNTATNTALGSATFVSKSVNDYTFFFTVLDTHLNGLTDISITGQTSTDSCSIGSSIGTFNIDTQLPTVLVSHSPLGATTNDAVTITATGNDVSKNGHQSGLKEIRIFVDDALKQTCISSSCTFSSTYSVGTHNYFAEIDDNAGNSARDPISGTKSFTISPPPTLSLSASPLSVVADGVSISTLAALTSDSLSGIIVSFSSNRIADTFSATTCTTDASGICSVTVKSSTAGTSTITGSATGYTSGTASVTFTIPPPPTCSAPSFPTNACSVTTDSITLSWNSVTGASQYSVTKCDANGQNCDAGSSTTASSKSFTGLSANTQYTLKVRVSSSDATCTPPSSEATTTCTTDSLILPTCQVPSSLSCLAIGSTGLQGSWSAVSGVTNYRLAWCPLGTSFGSPDCGFTTNPGTSALGLELDASKRYKARVRVEDSSSCSVPGPWSEEINCFPAPSAYALHVQPFVIIPSDTSSQYSAQSSTLTTKLNDALSEIREWYLSRLPGKNLDVRSYIPVFSSRSKAWHECQSIINENGLNCNLNDPFANALKAIQDQEGLNIDVWTNQPCDRKFIILFYKHSPGYAGTFGFQNPRSCVTVNAQTIQSSGGTATIGSAAIYSILNDAVSIEECYQEYERFGVNRNDFPANNCPLRGTGVYTIAHELGHTLGVFDYCGSSSIITSNVAIGLMHPFESDLNQAELDCQLTYSKPYQQSYADDSMMGSTHRIYPFTPDTGLNVWEIDALNRDPFFFT